MHLKEYFIHEDVEGLERAKRLAGHPRDVRTFEYRNMCLAFEPLGKSLFDFIKYNKYKGKRFKFNNVIFRL